MAGVSANCTSMTITGLDFSGVSNLISSRLLITKGCCADAGDPVELIIDPGTGETQDITTNIAATGTLTLTDNISNNETVTINGKVYTFEDTLTDVDGHVQIGADADETIDNFVAALDLSGTAGTQYASSTTANADVTGINGEGDTMTVTAITAGASGNAITTTETSATASWAEATLSGGDAGTSVTLYADDLGQGDYGDVLGDGVYTVTAQWEYSSGSTSVTQTDTTCVVATCTLRCQVDNAVKAYYIDNDPTYTKDQINEMMDLYYSLLEGAIPCEKCNTACQLYSHIYTMINNTDCQCQ